MTVMPVPVIAVTVMSMPMVVPMSVAVPMSVTVPMSVMSVAVPMSASHRPPLSANLSWPAGKNARPDLVDPLPPFSIRSAPAKWRASEQRRFARDMAWSPNRYRILSPCGAIPPDKVPGAPGVGAIGAATLLQRYGSLEAALAAGRFPAQAENLRLYRSIATMNKKAPLPSLRSQEPTWRKAAVLANELELNQLARRPLGSSKPTVEQAKLAANRR